MSLTSLLADKSSALHRFMADEFPNTADVLADYRARLPVGFEAVRPVPLVETRVAWSTLGIAIDHRLRFALSSAGLRRGAVARAIAGIRAPYLRFRGAGRDLWSAIPVVFSRTMSPIDDEVLLPADEAALARFGLATGRALLRAGIALLDEADHLVEEHIPYDRASPMLKPHDIEERLGRVCYVSAWYEETLRTGQIFPGTPLGEAVETVTLEDLLAAVPDYAVDDIAQVIVLAEDGLGAVRSNTTPQDVVVGPVFTGSPLVGGADADWIAGGLLCDVKSTATPRRLEARDVWQLVGYSLLDIDDRYAIKQVGWYLSRLGRLVTWDINDILTMLAARRPVADLRVQLKERLER